MTLLPTRNLILNEILTNKTVNKTLLFTGIFISKIATGSTAAKESNLYVGDRVISVSNN